MKNRVYFFTGTGNSLKIAKDIANSLPECEIVAIHKDTDVTVPAGYDRIGFVFPVYFFGLPDLVVNFIRKVQLSQENAKYFFAIATPGGFSGKPIAQVDRLFKEKDIHLNYGGKIRLNANFIVRYGSIGLYYKTAMNSYDKRIQKAIHNIKNMQSNKIEKYSKQVEKTYLNSICNVHETDNGYHANENCTACGICVSVCPAKNIELKNGSLVFRHQCESCMACIQYCPQRALNYKDKTQKRKRYTHPEIKHTEISKYYNN